MESIQLLGVQIGIGLIFLLLLRAVIRSAIKPIAPTGLDHQPGKFRVSGVDRSTKMDTSGYFEAESAANARAKAELEGIVVTKVERA